MYFKEKTTFIEDEIIKENLNYLEFKEENIFIIIVFIYVLILKEFEPKEYLSLLNYEKRISKYSDINTKNIINEADTKKVAQNLDIDKVRTQLKNLEKKFNLITLNLKKDNNTEIIHLFLSDLDNNYRYDSKIENILDNLKIYSDNTAYKFCRYILNVEYENTISVKIADIIYIIENLL